ncbi:MAG: GTPase ObgE [Spirochaetales bacterium]
MIQFADEALIEVRSGKGGNGCIAFRREKYVPHGGPSGGDGGRGGDVLFKVKRNLRTLAHLRHKHIFKAKGGTDGSSNNRYGADGEDVVVYLPPGTRVTDAETGVFICEFLDTSENEEFLFLQGGNGGWGNVHFKSSVNRAPRRANEGQPGETRKLRIELSIMADIGLVGFPNAGKSSLLDFFTNARPKIAPYPFTTKIPNLGVLHTDDENSVIIADIPGIIEGAGEGAGLGIRFLKHISRTAGLAFIIDCSDDNYLTAYEKLIEELTIFSEALLKKPRILLFNKIDCDDAAVRAAELSAKYTDINCLAMSVHTKEGLPKVKEALAELARQAEDQNTANEGTAFSLQSDFLKTRAMVCDDDETVQYPGSE